MPPLLFQRKGLLDRSSYKYPRIVIVPITLAWNRQSSLIKSSSVRRIHISMRSEILKMEGKWQPRDVFRKVRSFLITSILCRLMPVVIKITSMSLIEYTTWLGPGLIAYKSTGFHGCMNSPSNGIVMSYHLPWPSAKDLYFEKYKSPFSKTIPLAAFWRRICDIISVTSRKRDIHHDIRR